MASARGERHLYSMQRLPALTMASKQLTAVTGAWAAPQRHRCPCAAPSIPSPRQTKGPTGASVHPNGQITLSKALTAVFPTKLIAYLTVSLVLCLLTLHNHYRGSKYDDNRLPDPAQRRRPLFNILGTREKITARHCVMIPASNARTTPPIA